MASTDYAHVRTPSTIPTSSQSQFLSKAPDRSSGTSQPDSSQYGFSNGLPTPQSAPMSGLQGDVLPLPSWLHAPLPGPSSQQYGQSFDTTGQIAPPGMKPRVTATLWEDEGSLCFQVEAKGVCVARREDNHMINGTKLLNVAGMTRGRRDGILKAEQLRHVVKIGPMHLKGVWIPFERALDFANKEKITELLYPLFVHNVGALLYHPSNQTRTNAVMAAAERRKQEHNQIRNAQAAGSSSLPPPQHVHPMNAALSSSGAAPSHTLMSHPGLHREQTFPTPPASASNVTGLASEPDRGFQWVSKLSKLPGDTGNVVSSPQQSYNAMEQGRCNTPPRVQPPSSNLYNVIVIKSERGNPNSIAGGGVCDSQSEIENSMLNRHTQELLVDQELVMNKLGRDSDDHDPLFSRGAGAIVDFNDQKTREIVSSSVQPSNKRGRAETPETTPPPTSDGNALQDPRFSEAARNPSFSDGMHSMDEIRKIVLQRLSGDCADYSQKSPKQKRQKTDAENLSPSRCLDGSSRHSAEFRVHWKVKEFMEEQFGSLSKPSLGSVIALTGTALYAQATTVKDYFDTNWPRTGPVLLEIIQKAFDSGLGALETDFRGDLTDLKVFYRSFSTNLAMDSIIVHGSTQDVVEIAQQIAWLGSALRTSGTGQIGRSQVQLLARESHPSIDFDLHFITDRLPKGEKSCWHDLFVNPVIAYNFPIASRGEEIGLEIPVKMMASLGGAGRALEYEGGLVMKGFSTMFVPLRKSGNCIQWHFIRNEDDSRLEYWQAEKRCPGRALLDSVDQDSLASARAFLGWWGTTTTHLGSAEMNYDNIDWSAAKEPDRSATFSGGTIGFQNFATGELNFAVSPKDSKLHISRTGPYQRVVKFASRTPVVLYDTCEKRAWLVPSSAVIAHIAQTRTVREKFIINGKSVNIIPTDPAWNVYEAAEKMLLVNASTKLADGEGGRAGLYFRDLVLGVWSLLEYIMDKDIKKEASADPAVPLTTRKSLRGWEFMDLVDEISPIRQKEADIKKSCGDWPDLIRDINAVVLFASGFEDIIMPAEGSRNGLCHSWRTVPKDKDYLAATVPILNALYEKAGSRLTRKHLTSTHIQWHRGPSLFEKCTSGEGYICKCDRLQRIVHESHMSFGPANPPGPLKEQGAVIFGQAKHSLKTALSTPSRKNGIYSQGENVPLAVQIDTPDLPESASSSCCGSPSLLSLGSGTTFATSIQSENKGGRGLDETTQVPCPEDQATPRSLKRSREGAEYLQEARETQRQRPADYIGQRQDQHISSDNLDESIARIQPWDDQVSSGHYSLDGGLSKQKHVLRRKPTLHYPHKEIIDGRQRDCIKNRDTSPVCSHIQQRRR